MLNLLDHRCMCDVGCFVDVCFEPLESNGMFLKPRDHLDSKSAKVRA